MFTLNSLWNTNSYEENYIKDITLICIERLENAEYEELRQEDKKKEEKKEMI